MNTSLLTTDTPGKGVVRGAELVFVNLAPSAGQTGQRMVSRSSEPGSGTRAAAFAIRVLSANDGFRFQPMAALGTEATLGLRPISSVTLYRIAQYKIPLAFNALYFPYSETTHLFGVNSTD